MPGRERSAVLIIAHPGHELRVHGWLSLARPTTFVLTDGSGRASHGRLDSTSRLLARAGARPGTVYGRLTDAALYQAVLDGDVALFLALRNELAAALTALGAETVVVDAEEGYNPTHDLCRWMVESAAAAAGQGLDFPIHAYDFPLVGHPHSCPDALRRDARWIHLDDEAFGRKWAAACEYPELVGELRAAIDRFGKEVFRTECLRPLRAGEPCQAPYYEEYGARQVEAGFYDRVIRYREHMLPIREALSLRSHNPWPMRSPAS